MLNSTCARSRTDGAAALVVLAGELMVAFRRAEEELEQL
jgi:hypothetical protein